jgi:hypothetical protein
MIMKTTHTKGPWSWIKSRTLIHVETDMNNTSGAGIHICSLPLKDEANARLIASAPELLAALEAFADVTPDALKALDVYPEPVCTDSLFSALVNARAVIAKATGSEVQS